MTDPFCLECAADLFGAEDMEHVQRTVDAAPPMSFEQRERLRALFQSARVRRRPVEQSKKACGH